MRHCTQFLRFPTSLFAVFAFSLFLFQPVVGQQDTNQEQTKRPSPPQPDDDEEGNYTVFATGVVFHDIDNDGVYSGADSVFSNIKVSNGREIVKADDSGRYSIPLSDEGIVFVIKPTGFRTALDKNKLPKFYYVHKPNGSPKLKYPGSKPTGPISRDIDFPLYRQTEPDEFQVLMFGDPQPRNIKEVDYISHDVINQLVGKTSAKFGVTLGDIVFDDLSMFKPLNQSIALIGIPWYNVIGNHDINTDAKTRKHINETFEDNYGPSYYSFNYGQVHFVVLDNIDWVRASEKNPRAHFSANFGSRQLEFLKNDLALIPQSQMVVLMMHVPIMGTEDRQQLFRLIEDRPLCVSISGHTHYHKNVFLDEKAGWNGKQPHHHIINVTVSGSWWGGQKDERGIPHTTMADGAPNGYSIMTFDRDGYKLDFRAANRPANEQMAVQMPKSIDSGKSAESEIWVNVYNGSEKSKVRMALAGTGQWITMEQKNVPDPNYVILFDEEQKVTPAINPKMAGPIPSSHLWVAKLPAELKPGTHLLTVETTDMYDRKFFAQRSFRVLDSPMTETSDTLKSK